MCTPLDFEPETIAKRVIKDGLTHTMSHALRAVEKFAHDYQRRDDLKHPRVVEYLRIKVRQLPTLQPYTGKRAMLYLGAEDGAVPGPHLRATIDIQRTLPPEEQRWCLAHELGHILMAFKRRESGKSFPQTFSEDDEKWCLRFADDLCKMLHYLYTETPFQRITKFPSIEITDEEKDRYADMFSVEIKRWERQEAESMATR